MCVYIYIYISKMKCFLYIFIERIVKIHRNVYNLRPRRPPFLRVESDGMGVTSSMRPIFIFERAKARRADCAPGPGVLVLLPPVALSLMCNAVIPRDLHFSATSYKVHMF